jgi:hypothetical protein
MAVEYYLISIARRLYRLKPERTYIFGRDEKADIQIVDQLISRRHAELTWSKDAWVLHDLGSRNGVSHNGRKIAAPTRLRDGSTVQVGGQRFRLFLAPPGTDPGTLLERAPRISEEETMGPDFNVQDIVSKGASFVGSIDAEGLLDLLQYFQVTGKTGRLDLTGGTNLAALWFDAGMPLHAFLGARVGLEALVELARHPPSKFAFHAGAPAPDRRTITTTLPAVLMEVARVVDEERRRAGGGAPTPP